MQCKFLSLDLLTTVRRFYVKAIIYHLTTFNNVKTCLVHDPATHIADQSRLAFISIHGPLEFYLTISKASATLLDRNTQPSFACRG